jgi:hypothetical protein
VIFVLEVCRRNFCQATRRFPGRAAERTHPRGVEIACLLDELRGSPIGGHHNNSLYRDLVRAEARDRIVGLEHHAPETTIFVVRLGTDERCAIVAPRVCP